MVYLAIYTLYQSKKPICMYSNIPPSILSQVGKGAHGRGAVRVSKSTWEEHCFEQCGLRRWARYGTEATWCWAWEATTSCKSPPMKIRSVTLSMLSSLKFLTRSTNGMKEPRYRACWKLTVIMFVNDTNVWTPLQFPEVYFILLLLLPLRLLRMQSSQGWKKQPTREGPLEGRRRRARTTSLVALLPETVSRGQCAHCDHGKFWWVWSVTTWCTSP